MDVRAARRGAVGAALMVAWCALLWGAEGRAQGAAPLRVSGFVQTQYEVHDLSEDELLQGGQPLNQDRFVVRRARLRVEHEGEDTVAQLELDGNTVRNVGVSARRANVGLVWRGERGSPPKVRLRAGLTEIPFGLELREGQDALLFAERSQGSLAFFPGPTDAGVRLDGAWGALRYDLAAMNGSPISDQGGGASLDPTRAWDVSGRLGAQGTLWGTTLGGGASALVGRGFHAGTQAEKSRVEWRDLNENDALDTGEVVAVPGRGPTPSETFERWAVGLDASLSAPLPWGEARLWGELALASNLDRGVFTADPVLAGADVRELQAYVSLSQELFGVGLLGFRFDLYDPDLDFLDSRRGFRVPQDASVTTYSPLVGVRLLGFGRVIFQYDAVVDSLARDARGVPTDLRNNRATFRLQGEF